MARIAAIDAKQVDTCAQQCQTSENEATRQSTRKRSWSIAPGSSRSKPCHSALHPETGGWSRQVGPHEPGEAPIDMFGRQWRSRRFSSLLTERGPHHGIGTLHRWEGGFPYLTSSSEIDWVIRGGSLGAQASRARSYSQACSRQRFHSRAIAERNEDGGSNRLQRIGAQSGGALRVLALKTDPAPSTNAIPMRAIMSSNAVVSSISRVLGCVAFRVQNGLASHALLHSCATAHAMGMLAGARRPR